MDASSRRPLHVVWFKRDLRVHDHAPLYEAARQAAAQGGAVLPLYVIEPLVTQAPDFSARHWAFVHASLAELRARLARKGQPLVVRAGEAVAVLQALHERHGPIAGLHAHQETGNARTFARDEAVRAWARAAGVPFAEHLQHAVFRRLPSRDAWSGRRAELMARPLAPAPEALPPLPGVDPGPLAAAALFPLRGVVPEGLQTGGEAAAERTLASFFARRGRDYRWAMSSPVTAFEACSRVSPHLAWGTLSLRRAVQEARAQKAAVAERPPAERRAWAKSLASFESRLVWFCHFQQKLEDAPRIEFESFVPALDALREDAFSVARYEAWAAGQTGYPLVDAAMRALEGTGYLNFRMRALLTSFAAYDLWLDWRRFGHHLARSWTDYVPGIHLAQLQMQSGTTGINTLRIYNPTKQAVEQDPEGTFIRRWVPELEAVPKAYLHRPWLMPQAVQRRAGCRLGRDYPKPLVDHAQAARQAKARFSEALRQDDVQRDAEAVLEKHGSRRRKHARRTTSQRTTAAIKKPAPPPSKQTALDL